jgi:hypothetical protein
MLCERSTDVRATWCAGLGGSPTDFEIASGAAAGASSSLWPFVCMYHARQGKLQAAEGLTVASHRVLHHPFEVWQAPLRSRAPETHDTAQLAHQEQCAGR